MTRTQKDNYKKTIEVYRKLGEKYIKDIKGLTPREFIGFVKLLPKKGRILDVGCAGGRDSEKFIKEGFEVIGIDLVDNFLEKAKRNVPKAKFVKMDLRNLKFPQKYFDGIWANAVLLHIDKKDISKVLKEFYRVLKIKGKLHIRVKKGKGIGYKKEKLSKGEKRLFTYFFKYELENFVRKAGFKIIFSKIVPDELGRKDVKWIIVWAEK